MMRREANPPRTRIITSGSHDMIINHLTATNFAPRPLPLPGNSQPQQALSSGSRVVPNTQPDKTTTVTSSNQIQQAVEAIQQTTESLAQNLQFTIDEDTGITVIKVLDSSTQEVIRQIPTEEAVTIARTLDKVKGLLFSDQA